MVEVCSFPRSRTMSVLTEADSMKHPDSNIEVFEFNLGQAYRLRCINSKKATVCGTCETCHLNSKLKEAREWLPKLGDHSKKRFMLGILGRFQSVDLLQQIVTLLQPLMCKDFTYARSRTQPSLTTDHTTLSADRALTTKQVEQFIQDTWSWFQKSNYWSKANYAMSLLQLCDSHLLHILATQARTLLISQEKAATLVDDEEFLEASSIADTDHSYHTEDHPDLDLLVRATPDYSLHQVNPFTGQSLYLQDEIENDDSGDESFFDSSLGSVDPACMVVSTSAKAASGVARYRDFIRCLPVHIAKYILGYLDIASLHNALCVSTNWRTLVEEVHNEFRVNQDLIEEVMLMQGAAAQAANPVYAADIDVLVPNLYPGTREVITTEDHIIKTKYKSEVNFDTAFSGISHRKVIMEERNVYCGSYNVFVLTDIEDPHRVVHTGKGQLIAIGSKDRKVRFLEKSSGKEKGPVITGHAGSIRCVHLCEDKGFVLSGSYDTSIRMWSLETGKCMRIFRGHRDTILAILVVDSYLVSGCKDNSCKVWDLSTGKCQRTFRHKHPVWAVAMNHELCITGCEAGKVKVWDVKAGDLIKTLNGHHAQVTSIRFDRWHIITGSKDGYALVWSAQGNHSRCLNALRHPQAVLCLEFQYLRVITGSEDGRLRIWNMVTGQCCRIMRGNSHSRPVQSIVAIGDRITLNTNENLLVLNFEEVEWDYTLENDRVPPLVQYGSYSDAPVRSQPYSYIRAQRMLRAGATNTKILLHDRQPEEPIKEGKYTPQNLYHAPQLPHSAKQLSSRCMLSARSIQSRQTDGALDSSHSFHGLDFRITASEGKLAGSVNQMSQKPSSTVAKPPLPKAPRPQTVKSGISGHSVVIADPPVVDDDDDDDEVGCSSPMLKRRISWAFEKPLVPKSKDVSLSEMKALLRSQMRVKAESIVPPDFIYLTVNAIQNSMKPSETNHNTSVNMKNMHTGVDILHNRPSSSPPKIDPRTRVEPGEIGLERFIPHDDKGESLSEISDIKSVKSFKSTKSSKLKNVGKEVYTTPCDISPTKTKLRLSLHSRKTKTYVPKGRVIRPISASATRREPQENSEEDKNARPLTAPALRPRPGTCGSVPSTIASTFPGVTPLHKKQPSTLSSTAFEANHVPMLMYPSDMKEKISQVIKEKRKLMANGDDGTGSVYNTPLPPGAMGKVSHYNDPMRTHIKFELRTFEQDKAYINSIEKMYENQIQKEEEVLEKKQRAAWLAKARIRPMTSQGKQNRTRPMSLRSNRTVN